MADLKKIGSISLKLLIIASISYFLNYIFNFKLSELLVLDSNLIVHEFQIWRLLTFPFSNSSIESYLLFFFTFLTISPKLEKHFKSINYFFFILLIICLQGSLFTIFYFDSGAKLYGPEGISFFILTLFMLINFNKNLILFNLKPIRAPFFVIFLSLFWLSSIISHSFIYQNNSNLSASFYSAGFGIISSAFIFLEMKLIEYIRKQKIKKEKKETTIEIPKPEELAIAYNKIKNSNYKLSEVVSSNEASYFEDFELSEDRLNMILDKINESGKDSLTLEELNFLKEYSQRI